MKNIIFKGICVLTALSVIGVAYVVIDYCNSTSNSYQSKSSYETVIDNEDNQNTFGSNNNYDVKDKNLINR